MFYLIMSGTRLCTFPTNFFSHWQNRREKNSKLTRTSFIGHRNGRSIRLPVYVTDCTRRTEEILLYIHIYIYLIIAIEPSRLSRENDVNRDRERRRRNVGLSRSKKDGSRAQRARGERNGLNEERERERERGERNGEACRAESCNADRRSSSRPPVSLLSLSPARSFAHPSLFVSYIHSIFCSLSLPPLPLHHVPFDPENFAFASLLPNRHLPPLDILYIHIFPV